MVRECVELFDWQLDGVVSVEVAVHVSNSLRPSPYNSDATYSGTKAGHRRS
jgi:hypothetical protein